VANIDNEPLLLSLPTKEARSRTRPCLRPEEAITNDWRTEVIRNWLAMRLLAHNMRALNAGDPGPTLRLQAADVHFRFPGTSSWAATLRGRDQVRAWLIDMAAAGVQHSYDEVVVAGPPWRVALALRGHDWIDDATGERVYANRYVIWGLLRWGRLTDYEVYEDTEKALELDRHRPRPSTACSRTPSGYVPPECLVS
jgi:ketosteroid isomerase-like protein